MTMAGQVYDEYLVLLVMGSDRRALARLASRWQPRLLSTARRLLRDEDQAQSAVQDAWLSILRGLDRLDDPARFGPWAFRILHRRCADEIRRNQRQRKHEAGDEIDDRVATMSPAAPDESAAVRAAMAGLPDDQRFAAQLHYVEGLSLADIAKAAGIPEGTVKSRLFHARRRLKAALEGEQP